MLISTNIFAQENDTTEAPFFQVHCKDTNNVAFPLISTNVDATISGVIASIEIEQVYVNSGDSAVEATYVFPLSTNAAVYAMQMEVGDRVIDAVIKEKNEAREIYEAAKDSGQRASLLEQHRPNVFQMSVANILSGDTIKVRMSYVELIEPENTIYQFVVPSIVGPRYTNGGEEWVYRSTLDSLLVQNTELKIDLRINAGMDVTAACTSHEVEFVNEGQVSYCHLDTHPGKDFIVDYALSGNQIETGLLLHEGEDENFFLAMIQPPKPEVSYDSPKREYVFIMDVSGSMSGEPIQVSKDLIVNLLQDLNADDKFNILFFAAGSAILSETSLPVTAENINRATQMIDQMNAGGGTHLLPAMQRALLLEGTANYSRIFVILTDGYVTVEKQSYELIREHLNEANFFSFGIGRSVNREIIEGMAYVGQGESFVVTDMANSETTADLFKKYIESPVLTNIEATFSDINVYDIEPLSIPDVFAERPILIYGKYENSGNGSISVKGDYAGGEISSSLNFGDYSPNKDENKALKYLWARRRIKLMSDYGIASNEDDTLTLEEEITNLGLKYGLVTEYTSFVAVDSMSVTYVDEEQPGGDDEEWVVSFDYQLTESRKTDKNLISIVGSNAVSFNILQVTVSQLDAGESDHIQLVLYDSRGIIAFIKEVSLADLEDSISIDLQNLAKGMYCISLIKNRQVLDTEKFVKLR